MVGGVSQIFQKAFIPPPIEVGDFSPEKVEYVILFMIKHPCKKKADGTIKKGIDNFIRDYSLDEFPQFFNVLKGDMSLVGTGNHALGQ